VWKEFMHVEIIVFCIVGILSKTWTNALYVLQVGTKNNASYCDGDNQGLADGNKRKRKGNAMNSVASI
jgi:hypothetical protein